MKKLLLLIMIVPMIGFGQCISGNCDNGLGTYLYEGGNEYSGQWKNGERDGLGQWIGTNGNWYQGSWKGNEKHGYGTYGWNTGEEYQGFWQYDKRHSLGIYMSDNPVKWYIYDLGQVQRSGSLCN
jgi:hypothetical protein